MKDAKYYSQHRLHHKEVNGHIVAVTCSNCNNIITFQNNEHQRRYPEYCKTCITERRLTMTRDYFKTEKGKAAHSRHTSKRRRKLDWIAMFENKFAATEKIDWHHMTDKYVVALPHDIHILYNGNDHRENMLELVLQIYEDEIINLIKTEEELGFTLFE